MSTDHYIVCEKHRVSIHIGQDGMSGYTFYSGEPKCMKALGRFLREHSLCTDDLRFKLEQYVIDDDYKEIDWHSDPDTEGKHEG